MSVQEKYKIAVNVAEIVSGSVWCPNKDRDCGPVRVYLAKKQGFFTIEDDGINIDLVGRSAFNDVKDALKKAGHNVYRA